MRVMRIRMGLGGIRMGLMRIRMRLGGIRMGLMRIRMTPMQIYIFGVQVPFRQ
jgi:hypothetical protein